MLKDNNLQKINNLNKINLYNNTQEREQKNVNISNCNEFISSDHDFNWKYSHTFSYHFDKDIERVWILLKNFEMLTFFSDLGNSSCIFLKGQDTWKEGNEFKGSFFGNIPYVARVNMCLDLHEVKKIEWLLKSQVYFIIKLELFKVTDDDSTVIIKELKFEDEKSKIIAEDRNYKLVDNSLFDKLNQLLEKEPINLIKYESAIIEGKMGDIWDIITDFTKMTTIAPNNNFLPNINLRNMKIGEIKEASLFYNNEINYFKVALRYKEEKPKWNKWKIVFDVTLKDSQNPKYIVIFQLTKINANECQLVIINKYNELVPSKEFKEIGDSQKYLLLSIKDYFENFFSSFEE